MFFKKYKNVNSRHLQNIPVDQMRRNIYIYGIVFTWTMMSYSHQYMYVKKNYILVEYCYLQDQ